MRGEVRRGRRAGSALATVVLLIGLAVSAGAGTLVRVVEEHSAAQIMDRRAGLAQSAVAAEVRRC